MAEGKTGPCSRMKQAIELGMVGISKREAYMDLVWPKIAIAQRENLARCYTVFFSQSLLEQALDRSRIKRC